MTPIPGCPRRAAVLPPASITDAGRRPLRFASAFAHVSARHLLLLTEHRDRLLPRSDDGASPSGRVFQSTSSPPERCRCSGRARHLRRPAWPRPRRARRHRLRSQRALLDANSVTRPGFAVSTDNGLTWVVRTVPTPKASARARPVRRRPERTNTIYLGYVNADGHARIAVTATADCTGASPSTWHAVRESRSRVRRGDRRRRQPRGLRLSAPDARPTRRRRASPASGTCTAPSPTTAAAPSPPSTSRPATPVQRGCIWNKGGSNPCRNLLDFNDITVDRVGRVLIGYADGCTGSCVHDPTQNPPRSCQRAGRARHHRAPGGGRGLFAAFDGTQFGRNDGDNEGAARSARATPRASQRRPGLQRPRRRRRLTSEPASALRNESGGPRDLSSRGSLPPMLMRRMAFLRRT